MSILTRLNERVASWLGDDGDDLSVHETGLVPVDEPACLGDDERCDQPDCPAPGHPLRPAPYDYLG